MCLSRSACGARFCCPIASLLEDRTPLRLAGRSLCWIKPQAWRAFSFSYSAQFCLVGSMLHTPLPCPPCAPKFSPLGPIRPASNDPTRFLPLDSVPSVSGAGGIGSAKRRAALQGRPSSSSEAVGQGYSSSSSEAVGHQTQPHLPLRHLALMAVRGIAAQTQQNTTTGQDRYARAHRQQSDASL